MKKVSLNEFKDCIVDENNNIVAEKPRWFDRKKWEQGEMLVEAFNKKLNLANVSGSLLSDLDYWKQRCELAEKCLEESPCDPDITSDQIKAHNTYNKFISNFGNDR